MRSDINVVYGCCTGDWEKFQRNVISRVQNRRIIATSGHTGIVAPYNMILDAVVDWNLDALILLHDDLELTDPDGEEKLINALADPQVALAGVAGGGGGSLYWWDHSPIGHQLTDVTNIDFGTREGEVTLVEGSIMALSPWLIRNLRFDSIFTGFHGYDEIGMQIRSHGKKSVVVDVDTHHHNPTGYSSPESAEMCRLANQLYKEKWGLP